MDQTSLTKVFDLLSPRFLLLLPLVFFILRYISSPSSKNQSLPPGPRPWPILGNLLHLGKKPHISMASFATTHGPLISLNLGKQLLVVGSSKRAATEILKSHDRLLSARYVSKAALFESHVLDRIAIVWATQCSDGWKSLRALCRNELFSATAIESQAVLREKKMEEMVEFIGRREGEVVRIGEVVLAIVFNTIANLIFSVDLIGLEDDGAATGLKSLMWKMMKLGATPNIADFYPILGGTDLQGLKRKMAVCANQMFGVWGKHIKERREKHVQDGPRSDFLDVFLANGFEDLQINWVAMGHDYEFLPFGAGRRICPGLTMAARQVHLIIASLLYHFDWSLPNGEDPAMLDMGEKFGITLQKEHPLLVVPRRRI
ncbi:3'-HYDROXYLASE ISOZYME putative-RELATED [Salix koriyanagi]|uniref:3'-HYDROXYLASE ISOZYME putative-RELATED n=1 Tax=Salix koriyanagi TaxID=2511006 RepID=A0A9Q0PI96_9ROSI|nr:3'-HYDROXYLASE ISOZYME putative-RELATED [Salix koriyanagi]